MKEYGVINVHCPDSNTNIASGVCPVRTFLKEGVWVNLGSDIAGGSLLPMPKNIQRAIKVSKIHTIISDYKDDFLTVNEGYYLATSSGHKFFDDSIGFEKGKKLHAVIVDDSSFPIPVRELTLQERFERAIYFMDKESRKTVYSEGKKVI